MVCAVYRIKKVKSSHSISVTKVIRQTEETTENNTHGLCTAKLLELSI